VDAQQYDQQALVQDHARPRRLLLGSGQVGGEVAQLGPGLRGVGGTGSFLELGLAQPAVGEVVLQQRDGLFSFGVGGADGPMPVPATAPGRLLRALWPGSGWPPRRQLGSCQRSGKARDTASTGVTAPAGH
jgi:hypothetical protein